MQQFIDFILINWTWLLPIFISVVESFFIVLLKQKPVYNLRDSLWCVIFYSLPMWINEAEDECKEGYNKMAYVLNKAVKNYPGLFTDQRALRDLRTYVEDILSTPQKKGE